MMRYLQIFIFSSLLVVAPVYAGAGHEHGDSHSHNDAGGQEEKPSHDNSDGHHGDSHGQISKLKVVDKATMKMKQLVAKGKIDKSWGSLKVASAEKKTLQYGPEWLVTFNNKKLKKVLYIFYTIDGRYLAANYTGK